MVHDAAEARVLAQPDVFVVERLLGERRVGSGKRRRKQYLVKWEGFDDAENTWEDEAMILDDDLIEAFRREHHTRRAAA